MLAADSAPPPGIGKREGGLLCFWVLGDGCTFPPNKAMEPTRNKPRAAHAWR